MAAPSIDIADSQPMEALPVPHCPEVQPADMETQMTIPGQPEVQNAAATETVQPDAQENLAGGSFPTTVPMETDQKPLPEASASVLVDGATHPVETETEKETMPQQSSLVTSEEADQKQGEADVESIVPRPISPVPSDIEDVEVFCRRCGCMHNVVDCVQRSEKEWWCKCCNNLVTLLRRNMAWPPANFASMGDEEQQLFFREAALTRNSTGFKYQRVRDLLVRNLTKRHTSVRSQSVGGTYKPLSVLKVQGYDIPTDFHERWPRQWSEDLGEKGDWTYLVAEVTVAEGDVEETVNESIVTAEKSIKKRKAKEALKDAEKPADDKTSGAASAPTNPPVVLDLLSESEEEIMVDTKKAKKELANQKKEQQKAVKKAAAEERKEAAKAKREAVAENRKIAALASKTVSNLNSACKAASGCEKEVADKLQLDVSSAQFASFKESLTKLNAWKKAACDALALQAKGGGEILDKLPYATEKDANSLVKEVQGHIAALKLLMKPPKASTGRKDKGKGKEAGKALV